MRRFFMWRGLVYRSRTRSLEFLHSVSGVFVQWSGVFSLRCIVQERAELRLREIVFPQCLVQGPKTIVCLDDSVQSRRVNTVKLTLIGARHQNFVLLGRAFP